MELFSKHSGLEDDSENNCKIDMERIFYLSSSVDEIDKSLVVILWWSLKRPVVVGSGSVRKMT